MTRTGSWSDRRGEQRREQNDGNQHAVNVSLRRQHWRGSRARNDGRGVGSLFSRLDRRPFSRTSDDPAVQARPLRRPARRTCAARFPCARSWRAHADHACRVVGRRACPECRCSESDGVVVIRPIAAWDDPTNMLNRPMASFNVTNAHVHEVLHVLLQAVRPSLFYPHTDLQLSSHARRDLRLSSKYIRMIERWEKNGRWTNPSARTLIEAALAACGSLACDGPNDPSSPALIDAPVSVTFPGGTMLDALNAVTRAHQSAVWWVGYLGNAADIELSTLDFWGGHAAISTAPLVLPRTRR